MKMGCYLLHHSLRRRKANYAWPAAMVTAFNLTAMMMAAKGSREPQDVQPAAGDTCSPEQLAAVVQPEGTPSVSRSWLPAEPARLGGTGTRPCLWLSQGMLH
ncbi:MAG TPA: hypothetical protein VNH82_01210 [Candidatus Dormibacteraeota bacterium]|nr:hypothetical protein [Candidatus Dormibacteraeota bacterium]